MGATTTKSQDKMLLGQGNSITASGATADPLLAYSMMGTYSLGTMGDRLEEMYPSVYKSLQRHWQGVPAELETQTVSPWDSRQWELFNNYAENVKDQYTKPQNYLPEEAAAYRYGTAAPAVANSIWANYAEPAYDTIWRNKTLPEANEAYAGPGYYSTGRAKSISDVSMEYENAKRAAYNKMLTGARDTSQISIGNQASLARGLQMRPLDMAYGMLQAQPYQTAAGILPEKQNLITSMFDKSAAPMGQYLGNRFSKYGQNQDQNNYMTNQEAAQYTKQEENAWDNYLNSQEQGG